MNFKTCHLLKIYWIASKSILKMRNSCNNSLMCSLYIGPSDLKWSRNKVSSTFLHSSFMMDHFLLKIHSRKIPFLFKSQFDCESSFWIPSQWWVDVRKVFIFSKSLYWRKSDVILFQLSSLGEDDLYWKILKWQKRK